MRLKSVVILVAAVAACICVIVPAAFAAPLDILQNMSWRRLPTVTAPREIVVAQNYEPGTIVVRTHERRLYYYVSGGEVIRYSIGVGRDGFRWSGITSVEAKRENPGWTPPPQMLKRQPYLPRHMAGGPNNPLGVRAMYLKGTLYRIHGTNEPDSIGHFVSSGCIRMRNSDVIDLYNRVKVGAKVVVLP